jgi:hypothetical protein
VAITPPNSRASFGDLRNLQPHIELVYWNRFEAHERMSDDAKNNAEEVIPALRVDLQDDSSLSVSKANIRARGTESHFSVDENILSYSVLRNH